MLSRSKKVMLTSAAAVVIILILVASAYMGLESSSKPSVTPTPTSTPLPATPTPTIEVAQKKPFYFGVTYCGNSTSEAKQLVDKVKNYTNLFVIQSGPLMSQLSKMTEICDYAVNSGLNIIVYYAYNGAADNTCANFTKIADSRWGSHFLGLYYNDEPGGKILDGGGAILVQPNGTTVNINYDDSICVSSRDEPTNSSISMTFYPSGDIQIYASQLFQDGSNQWNYTNYCTNGTISVTEVGQYLQNGTVIREPDLWYQPNGNVQDENGTLITDHGAISQFKPYQQVWDSCPLKTQADIANLYVNAKHNILSTTVRNQSNIKLMTADYALYWFDYQAGYDTIFAELGWDNNPAQEIGLVRGAAKMQNKEWGTIITWQSTHPPALQTGQQIYDEMKQSYESGAEYVIIFNYEQPQLLLILLDF